LAAFLVVWTGCGSSAPAQEISGGLDGAPADGAPAQDATMSPDGGLDAPASVDTGLTSSDASFPDTTAGCNPVVEGHLEEGFSHLPVCSPTTYGNEPALFRQSLRDLGNYGTYTKTFPPGFWVHNLEHGAVVITYNCPGGCPAEVAAAQALIDSLPIDCDRSSSRGGSSSCPSPALGRPIRGQRVERSR